MKYTIRFKIGNRAGAKSKYSLREFCAYIVDKYSLTEREVEYAVTMEVGDFFENEDLIIERVK